MDGQENTLWDVLAELETRVMELEGEDAILTAILYGGGMEEDTREAALCAVGFLLDELLERLKKDVKNGYAICKA